MTPAARAHGRTDTRVPAFRAAVRWCACAAALSGCAYYNGMYNANRWSKRAERSERAGRTAEARDRWTRAATHAESLIARHPDSRWADDAMLVRGRALVRLERYDAAVVVLGGAARTAGTTTQRHQAHLLLGQAYLGLRRPEEALPALDSAAVAEAAGLRDTALLLRARALLALGRPDEALRALEATFASAAPLERVRAALARSDSAQVVGYAESLATTPYVEHQWLPLLDSMSAAGLPDAAARVVEALRDRRDVSEGEKARALLADARRLQELGRRDEARDRLGLVRELVPDSSEARAAAVRLVALGLRDLATEAQLDTARTELARVRALGGAPGQEAAALERVVARLDSLAEGAELADARWFLRAELARDSLGAPALAARWFAQTPARFPDSPWTAKAVLAAIEAGHPGADSLLALLRERYPGSPYTAAALGPDPAPEVYAQLEDSLRVALEQARAARRPVAGEADGPDLRPRDRVRPAARPAPVAPRPTPSARPRVEP